MPRIAIVTLALLTGCVSAATEAEWKDLTRDVEGVSAPDPAAPVPPELETQATVELILATARARNPELRQALHQAGAALERVGQAAAWEDVVLKVALDDGAVASPFALERAGSLMVGLMQMIPALGKIDARTSGAVADGRKALEEFRTRERELDRLVRRAFAQYYETSRVHLVHGQHERVLQDVARIAAAKYEAGTVEQTDLLKAQIELGRLRTEVAMNQRDAVLAVARLNQLMHRPVDALLGPPAAGDPAPEPFETAPLLREAFEARPEIQAARWALESARRQEKLAGVEAAVPDFNVEAMYGVAVEAPDMFDAAVALNLPWLNSGRAARRRETGRLTAAAEDAALALADMVGYEVRSAVAEAEAARTAAEVTRTEILTRARQTLEVTRLGYEGNTVGFLELLDSERMLRDEEVEYHRTLARYQQAVADLRRAVGR